MEEVKRADRTQSVEQFWEDIRPKKDYTLQIAGGAVAAVALLIAGLWSPVKTYFEDQRNATIIQNIVQGGEAAIPDALAQVVTFDERSRRAVLENEEAKKRVLDYFMGLAQAEADYDAGKFNYRYSTLGFQDAANLDDGDMWPVSYALLQWSPVVEEKVVELVKAAVHQ